MPYAVTHVIIAIVIADLIWHYILKKKLKLYYILVAGVFGLLPDADYFIYYVFNPLLGTAASSVHRIFSHSFIWIFAILFLSLLFHKKMFFYMAALGFIIHLVLDGVLSGNIYPLAPFLNYKLGLNLLGGTYGSAVLMGLDAVILVGWLYHEYKYHKIKDFF